MTRRALALLAALPIVGAAWPASAGSVTGTIEITMTLATPPMRTRGFLDRIDNPYLPVRKVDPMPDLVVVLEGGPGGDVPPSPAVTWYFLGESFSPPLLPVVAGGEVELKNLGRNTPSLTAEGDPSLLPTPALNPSQSERFKVDNPVHVVTVRDAKAPHRIGRLLVLPGPTFAVPQSSGKFEIANVPPGDYTVKVWYQTGWLAQPPVKLTVAAKGASINLKLDSLALAGQ